MTDKYQLVREVFAELSKPGASVWLTHMRNARDVVRIGVQTTVLEYRSQIGKWLPFVISPEQWLSAEPCREPRVFEFEYTGNNVVPMEILRLADGGVRFHARFEEILP